MSNTILPTTDDADDAEFDADMARLYELLPLAVERGIPLPPKE